MNDIVVHRESVAHDERNVVLLNALSAKGVDLQVRRPIDLFFYVVSESAAYLLGRALKVVEIEVVRTGPPSETHPEWRLEARASLTPQEVAAGEYTRSLVRLAAAHGARYDGWGTQL